MIADERNDDNLAVAQTHLAFIRFHNRVVDTLPASVPAALRFARARELVTKHYQWMIRSDYLPRICEETVLDDVFTNGRKAFEATADGDRPADDADRVLRRRVPARALDGPRRLQVEPAPRDGQDREAVPVLGEERRPRRKGAAAERHDRGLPPAVRPRWGRAQFRDADRHAADRLSESPASGQLRRAGRAARESALEPRVPQPDARADGQAGQRAADGGLPHAGLRREAGPSSRGGRSSRARTAPRSTGSAPSARTSSSSTRRSGSTSCARRSATAAS